MGEENNKNAWTENVIQGMVFLFSNEKWFETDIALLLEL